MTSLLMLLLLAAPPASDAAEKWVLTVLEASMAGPKDRKVWLGVRNDNPMPLAVCVANTSWSGADTGAFSSATHACTTESEAHLVLPGQSHYVLTSVARTPSGERIKFGVGLKVWRANQEITSAPTPSRDVSGEWTVP